MRPGGIEPGGISATSNDEIPGSEARTERLHAISRLAAFEPQLWDDAVAGEVRAMFDFRAPEWFSRRSPEYLAPLAAAFDASGVSGRVCLDIGAGTTIHEETIRVHFDRVIAIDLSAEMLARADRTAAALVRGDASALPIADGQADAIVCVNMFLFAAEYSRVLAPSGSIVFVSTRGPATPIYLDPKDVLTALGRFGDTAFSATSGSAGEGHWTVVHRTTDEGDKA